MNNFLKNVITINAMLKILDITSSRVWDLYIFLINLDLELCFQPKHVFAHYVSQ